jgi:hypothetical protein
LGLNDALFQFLLHVFISFCLKIKIGQHETPTVGQRYAVPSFLVPTDGFYEVSRFHFETAARVVRTLCPIAAEAIPCHRHISLPAETQRLSCDQQKRTAEYLFQGFKVHLSEAFVTIHLFVHVVFALVLFVFTGYEFRRSQRRELGPTQCGYFILQTRVHMLLLDNFSCNQLMKVSRKT